MEVFRWRWKYPDDNENVEIIFDKYGVRESRRDKNGNWPGYPPNMIMINELEKAYQKHKHYIREQKLKRILNGKI